MQFITGTYDINLLSEGIKHEVAHKTRFNLFKKNAPYNIQFAKHIKIRFYMTGNGGLKQVKSGTNSGLTVQFVLSKQ